MSHVKLFWNREYYSPVTKAGGNQMFHIFSHCVMNRCEVLPRFHHCFQWLHALLSEPGLGRWKSAMTAASLCWPPSNPLISRTSKRTKRRCTQPQAMPSYAAVPIASPRLFSSMDSREPTSESLQSLKPCPTLSDGADFGCVKYARIRRQKNVDFLRCHWMWSDSVLVYECLSSTEEEQNNSTLGLALSDKHTVMARLCLFQFNCNLRCCCSSPRDCS